MTNEPRVSLIDLAMCVSGAMDLANPILVNHHKQVAYIASRIGAELGLTGEERNELALAGLLHDVGALSLEDRLGTMEFELNDPHRHAELGYLFLKNFEPVSAEAVLVRHHHIQWNEGAGTEFDGRQVPIGSHILHLADRIAVLISKKQEVLGQVKTIRTRIEEQSGKMFMPHLVDAFKGLACKEYFWLDASSQAIAQVFRNSSGSRTIELDADGILSFSDLFRQIIDFRSRFTANHSSGVAASAVALARLSGFDERDCQLMKIAGHLHDLGKVAIPEGILGKPAKLTEDEINIIRSHTYHTYRTLESIHGFETINAWSAFHHERLDGSGYPFHIRGNDLSLGSRIMAVADVFVAITEDRPYRKGMLMHEALRILQQMAENSALDSSLVSLLNTHVDDVNSLRMAAQSASTQEYSGVLQPLS